MSTSVGSKTILPTGYDKHTMMGYTGFNCSSNNQIYNYAMSISTMSNGQYGL